MALCMLWGRGGLARGGWEGGGQLEKAGQGDSLWPFGLFDQVVDKWVADPDCGWGCRGRPEGGGIAAGVDQMELD